MRLPALRRCVACSLGGHAPRLRGSMILTEIENHEDAWPFHLPVNLNFVPGYTKVIKKPMDFSTIREKLISGQYPNLEAFAVDVRLVFDNCEAFNQDDSDTGRAGHSMRKYFEKKWTDTLKASLLQQPRPLVIGLCDLSANLGRTGKHTQRIFKG
ncbi:Bromodomain adjacent to zinc finger domain protein 2B [Manis javanica]|nr:Bromodomain adjacent to zinc finger domain protein 2B [Manis javanica]